MEQKNVLLSALSVGVGVGLGAGLGLRSGLLGNHESCDKLYDEQIEQEFLRLVIDGKECKETFQEFPYYLRWLNILTISCYQEYYRLYFTCKKSNYFIWIYFA